MFKTWIFLYVFALCAIAPQAQTSDSVKVYLMNGNVKTSRFVSHIEEGIIILDGNKTQLIKPENVFSYVLAGTEHILYKPNDSLDYSVEEMRDFLKGRSIAKNYHKSPMSTIIGFASGVSGGYFLAFWSFLTTAAIATTDASINPFVFTKKTKVFKEEFEKNPALKDGFNTQAKRKKTKNQILGGLGGLSIGLSLYQYMRREKLKEQDE